MTWYNNRCPNWNDGGARDTWVSLKKIRVDLRVHSEQLWAAGNICYLCLTNKTWIKLLPWGSGIQIINGYERKRSEKLQTETVTKNKRKYSLLRRTQVFGGNKVEEF